MMEKLKDEFPPQTNFGFCSFNTMYMFQCNIMYTCLIDTKSVLASLAHSLVGRCMHNVVQRKSVYLNFPSLHMFLSS